MRELGSVVATTARQSVRDLPVAEVVKIHIGDCGELIYRKIQLFFEHEQ